MLRAGVTLLSFPARAYCRSIEDYEAFLDRILGIKD